MTLHGIIYIQNNKEHTSGDIDLEKSYIQGEECTKRTYIYKKRYIYVEDINIREHTHEICTNIEES